VSDEYLRANRELWDTWADLHVASEFYDVEAFKAGADSLNPEDDELGDVTGRTLLHLQCHFGKDTLSWARREAIVTGADFSPRAIEAARDLADELAIPATFVCSRIDELPGALDGRFDIVYTSRGVLGWLPDLASWAGVIAHFLTPGGTFFIHEMHPVMWLFDDEAAETELRVRYPYFRTPEPFRFETQGSYAVPEAEMRGVEYAWPHSLDEIIGSLLDVGLRIVSFREHPTMFFRFLPFMVEDDAGTWRLPDGMPQLPLAFTLRAVKD
jgi:SAM-dependent methyltransferase